MGKTIFLVQMIGTGLCNHFPLSEDNLEERKYLRNGTRKINLRFQGEA